MRVLVQNVSEQCIPNLVAVKSFRPEKIIWVFTPQMGDVLNRLRGLVQKLNASIEQQNHRVDAGDVEKMHASFERLFSFLPDGAEVIYHLTGGTKAMALQGLYNLGRYRRRKMEENRVQAVVMNPATQYFDCIYPEARNGVERCARLGLEEIVAVHGNQILDWGLSLSFCAERFEIFERLRRLAPSIAAVITGAQARKSAEQNEIVIENRRLPKALRQAFELVNQAGLAKVEIDGQRIRWRKARFQGDLLAYVRNAWLEHWTAAVLGKALSDWDGGGSGIKVALTNARNAKNKAKPFMATSRRSMCSLRAPTISFIGLANGSSSFSRSIFLRWMRCATKSAGATITRPGLSVFPRRALERACGKRPKGFVCT